MAAPATRAGDTGLVLDWRCEHCDRFLARVVGDRFATPSGVTGHLPGLIRCPTCKWENTRRAPVDVMRRAS